MLLILGVGCKDDAAETFSQKEKCASYINDIEQRLKIQKDETGSVYLHEIFYSKKANSCLYITHENRFFSKSNRYVADRLLDYLTNETIATSDYSVIDGEYTPTNWSQEHGEYLLRVMEYRDSN